VNNLFSRGSLLQVGLLLGLDEDPDSDMRHSFTRFIVATVPGMVILLRASICRVLFAFRTQSSLFIYVSGCAKISVCISARIWRDNIVGVQTINAVSDQHSR
jgi:hypothetical protein